MSTFFCLMLSIYSEKVFVVCLFVRIFVAQW